MTHGLITVYTTDAAFCFRLFSYIIFSALLRLMCKTLLLCVKKVSMLRQALELLFRWEQCLKAMREAVQDLFSAIVFALRRSRTAGILNNLIVLRFCSGRSIVEPADSWTLNSSFSTCVESMPVMWESVCIVWSVGYWRCAHCQVEPDNEYITSDDNDDDITGDWTTREINTSFGRRAIAVVTEITWERDDSISCY